jgi:8-oxo-dGTP diphosphatase
MKPYEIFFEPPLDFKPTVSAASCYCEFEDKILLLKRNPDKPLGTAWGTPGGRMEESETPRQAVIREVSEEVGITLLDSELEELPEIYVRAAHADVILHRFRNVFTTQPSIDLNLLEHSEAQWFKLKDALELPLVTGCVAALRSTP